MYRLTNGILNMQYREICGRVFGFQINSSESELLPASTREFIPSYFRYKWVVNELKYLVVYIPFNLQELVKQNYGKLLRAIKKDLGAWHQLSLSCLVYMNAIRVFFQCFCTIFKPILYTLAIWRDYFNLAKNPEWLYLIIQNFRNFFKCSSMAFKQKQPEGIRDQSIQRNSWL